MSDMHFAPGILDRSTLLQALRAYRKGDFSVRLPLDLIGTDGEIASAFNDVVELHQMYADELLHIRDKVGKEGRIHQRMRLAHAAGAWSDSVDSVNTLIGDLAHPTAEIARVIESVARGDLSQTLALEIEGRPLCGEFLRIAKVVNTMVAQLGAFASEVSRVAREVGTDGKLGGQAQVPGVAGTWKDLTNNVNLMAANLTGQVRNIAEVTTAVAKGDLSKKITVDVKGEILELKSTINTMVDQLNAFASEVSRVAREVGTDGRLGGQARVPGAIGLWRDVTDNVNQLAANLTTQVRAIAEVATAVTKGDCTRSIMVEARGEVAALKDNINEMIRNLENTTLKNAEQNWLKTNVAHFARMLQGHRDPVTISRMVLSEVAPLVDAQQGVFYACTRGEQEARLELMASYAHRPNRSLPRVLRFGEGLVGQCAVDRKRLLLSEIPGGHLRIGSVLGASVPLNVVILPVLFEGEVKAVIELASLRRFSDTHLSFLDELTESIGIVLNTIEAGMRTEDLLRQSQSLTRELQSQQRELKTTNDRLEQQAQNLQRSEAQLKKQQEELRATNEQLQEKAKLLSEQMQEVELKNREVEQAKAALEEKAAQLALSSRYKSEFLANMSHELRTPLNSLLILAKLLAENPGEHLSPKQVEYAETIYAAGTDLLSLISDILDLAKIESGTVTLNVVPERFCDLRDHVVRTFRQVADSRQLQFSVTLDRSLPPYLHTDIKRLQQILKNLLSNAFKFTHRGRVTLDIAAVSLGRSRPRNGRLRSDSLIAFSVRDTGIGIPAEKQGVIFEAFQQADGTTSREYGGTGLGLSISRELARLLGGEISVSSMEGEGSTFTLYLPLFHNAAAQRAAGGRPAALAWQPRQAAAFPISGPRTPPAREQDVERIALLVGNDGDVAAHLLDVAADSGFKGVLVREVGRAFVLAQQLRPELVTFVLNGPPPRDAWALLDRLKHTPDTSNIPASALSLGGDGRHAQHISCLRAVRPTAMERLKRLLGAVCGLDMASPRVLLIGQDAGSALLLDALHGIEPAAVVENACQALQLISTQRFDYVIASASHTDVQSGEKMKKMAISELACPVPLVLYDAKAAEMAGAGSAQYDIMVVHGLGGREPVLGEARRFFQYSAAHPLQRKPRDSISREKTPVHHLAGRKVLIVDDDVRNIFALAGALEQHGMVVLTADNGRDAIETLERHADSDAVLMDIMMPELDGYDTMRVIRGMERFGRLPIIAVTARAMQGDREKCIEAGASDYIAKPVDLEQLLTMLDCWLKK